MANWEMKIERGECQCNSFFPPPYYKCSGWLLKFMGGAGQTGRKKPWAAEYILMFYVKPFLLISALLLLKQSHSFINCDVHNSRQWLKEPSDCREKQLCDVTAYITAQQQMQKFGLKSSTRSIPGVSETELRRVRSLTLAFCMSLMIKCLAALRFNHWDSRTHAGLRQMDSSLLNASVFTLLLTLSLHFVFVVILSSIILHLCF